MRTLFAVALAAMLAGCASAGPKEIGTKPSETKAVTYKVPAKGITPSTAREHIARRTIWDRFWPTKSTTN